MNFLYGDSTPSRLTSNFLEFLRDAIDFSVFVLESNERIERGKAKIQALRQETDAEIARLDAFIRTVTGTIDQAEKGAEASATSQCATRLSALVLETQRATVAGLESALASDVARVDAEEAATREKCDEALAALLAPHDPPETTLVTRLMLVPAGTYAATLHGDAPFGLEWESQLGVPEGSLWTSAVRLDRVAPQLEIRAPQLTGWISKEVKIRPQKLERHVVTELVDDKSRVKLKLRPEPGVEAGFDLDIDPGARSVHAARVGPANDASVGPFDVADEDVPALVELAAKLRASLAGFERVDLLATNVDGGEFHTLPSFVPFVERLVAMLAPIVLEISERSLTPTELVLRRALANDRREELFVAKGTLRDKYAHLSEPLRALFAPLRLDRDPPLARAKAPPAPSVRAADQPPRAEIPHSRPPPPLPLKAGKSTLPQTISSVDIEIEPPRPPLPTAPGIAPPAPETTPGLAGLAQAPSSSPMVAADAAPTNEALAATLKKIVTLTKNGRVDEAYEEFTELFSSPAFADYEPDEQRHALRLMVLTKSPPPKDENVLDAHRAAMQRIRTLVDTLDDPVDHEMLGVTYLVFDDTSAAKASFETALERARARDPKSDLCSALEKRVQEIRTSVTGAA